MAIEETLFQHPSGVVITNARAILGSKTYAMANITSVAMGRTPPHRGIGILTLFFGGVILLGGLIGEHAGFTVLGLIVGGIGLALAITAKPHFRVMVGSSSGEGEALVSPDRAYIEAIVRSLNDAIIGRG